MLVVHLITAVFIAGGSPDPGDPHVVAIVDAHGDAVCSGTLIAPRVVLSAAHCPVDERTYLDLTVFFGADVADAGTRIAIVDVQRHPAFDATTYANDAVLLHLADAAPTAPVVLASSVDGTIAGQLVRVVGFGDYIAGGGSGVKRHGTASVVAVEADMFTLDRSPAQPCRGDSGGPAFLSVDATEQVIGIASRGDAQCVGYAIETRVDVLRAPFIDPYLAETGPGVRAVGERCFYDEHCASGDCRAAVDEPRLAFCGAACDDASDCPASMVCDGGTCGHPMPSPGALGAACVSDAECFHLECTAEQVCGRRCVADGREDCPDGFACRRVGAGVDFFCMAEQPRGGGSCAATTRPGAALPLAMTFGLALARRRRRR